MTMPRKETAHAELDRHEERLARSIEAYREAEAEAHAARGAVGLTAHRKPNVRVTFAR